MILLLLLLLIASPLFAQPAFTGNGIYGEEDGSMDDRCVIFQVLLDSPTTTPDIRMRYGETEGALTYTSQSRGTDNSSVQRRWRVCDLKPATTYYYSLEMSDGGATWSSEQTCPVTCTDCTPTDHAFFAALGHGHSNTNCTTGENPRFTTLAEDSGIPVAPIPPSHSFSAITPAADNIHDAGADSTSLNTAHNAAETAAQGGGTVERIALRTTGTYYSTFDLRNISAGRIQVASEHTGTALLPPDGVRINPSFFPYMGRLTMDPADPGAWVQINVDGTDSGDGKYDFKQVILGPPDHRAVSKITKAITAIDVTANTITVADTEPFETNNIVALNLSGTGVTGCHGPVWLINVLDSPETFQVSFLEGGSACDLVGTYGSGGNVSLWVSQAITGHADCGNGEHCITVTGHDIGNYPALTITGNTSATTVNVSGNPSQYNLSANHSVYIVGSSDASCNGWWAVASVTTSTVALRGAVDCDNATDGSLYRLRPFWVFGTDDDTLGSRRRRKVHNFFVEDANTIRLLGSTANASATGGYIAWEGPIIGENVLRLGAGSGINNISARFDQVAFYCPFPWRCNWANVARTEDLVVRDSWMEMDGYKLLDPLTGRQESLWTGEIARDSQLQEWYFHGSYDHQYLNNALLKSVTMFADSSVQENLDNTISGNLMFLPEYTAMNRPDSDGADRKYLYCLEMKAVRRFAFIGNYLKGCREDFNDNGFAVGVPTGGGSGNSRDLKFAWNTITDSAGGFGMFATEFANFEMEVVKRIEFSHNVMVNIRHTYCKDPASCRAGTFLAPWLIAEDINVTRNTYHAESGWHPYVIRPSGQRSQGGVYNKNMFVVTEGAFDQIAIFGNFNPNHVPTTTADAGYAAFQQNYMRDGVFDSTRSAFSDNVWVPGLENSLGGVFATKAASTQNSDTICKDELTARDDFGFPAPFAVVGASGACSGNNVDSFNSRMALAWQANWAPQAAYTGYGADIKAVNSAQGWMGDLQVSATSTTATISWTPSGSEDCTVDVAAVADGYFDLAGEIIRQVDAGDDSELFTGLTPGTEYRYRVFCKEELDGRFTTAP